MPVDRPRNLIEQVLGIPAMKPGETLIDGDLTVYCGTWEGIRFIDEPVIEHIPPVEHLICPNQPGAEPCDCPECRKSNVRLVSIDELNRLYPPKDDPK